MKFGSIFFILKYWSRICTIPIILFNPCICNKAKLKLSSQFSIYDNINMMTSRIIVYVIVILKKAYHNLKYQAIYKKISMTNNKQ